MPTPTQSQPHTPTLPRLAVMPCPDYAGKHPFHDQRWIVTEGTEIERGHDPRPGQWATRNGSLVAEMRDCELGTAKAIVRACNSHAALVEALERLASPSRIRDGGDPDLEIARAALQLAKEGQP